MNAQKEKEAHLSIDSLASLTSASLSATCKSAQDPRIKELQTLFSWRMCLQYEWSLKRRVCRACPVSFISWSWSASLITVSSSYSVVLHHYLHLLLISYASHFFLIPWSYSLLADCSSPVDDHRGLIITTFDRYRLVQIALCVDSQVSWENINNMLMPPFMMISK